MRRHGLRIVEIAKQPDDIARVPAHFARPATRHSSAGLAPSAARHVSIFFAPIRFPMMCLI